jgi:hypothetical protein
MSDRLGPETRAIIQAINDANEKLIKTIKEQNSEYTTYSMGFNLPITIPTRLLQANKNRKYYMIQNHDAANYLAFSPNPHVVAGVFDGNEGAHLAAGQPVTDNVSKAEVWAVANTAAVNVTVVEVTKIPSGGS